MVVVVLLDTLGILQVVVSRRCVCTLLSRNSLIYGRLLLCVLATAKSIELS